MDKDLGSPIKKPRLVLICGPWSSGTSAVAGMFDAAGLNGLPPYFRTNDERTKNSFESIAFRKVIDLLASETDLSLKLRFEDRCKKLVEYAQELLSKYPDADKKTILFLKYPLSALTIRELSRAFNLRLIYVLRPMRDIESTRVRREWPEMYGAKGATIIFSRMFDAMINMNIPTFVIKYNQLVSAPERFTKGMFQFVGIELSEEQLAKASKFVDARKS